MGFFLLLPFLLRSFFLLHLVSLLFLDHLEKVSRELALHVHFIHHVNMEFLLISHISLHLSQSLFEQWWAHLFLALFLFFFLLLGILSPVEVSFCILPFTCIHIRARRISFLIRLVMLFFIFLFILLLLEIMLIGISLLYILVFFFILFVDLRQRLSSGWVVMISIFSFFSVMSLIWAFWASQILLLLLLLSVKFKGSAWHEFIRMVDIFRWHLVMLRMAAVFLHFYYLNLK